MRTTVGPLPSSVYWRRRAVVLGAVVLGIIVLFVAWPNGKDDKKPNGGRNAASNASSYPTPAPGGGTSGSASPDPIDSFVTAPAGGGPSLPNPADLTSQSAGAGQPTLPVQTTQPGANTNVTVPAANACADTELSVTPVLNAPTARRGTPIAIRFVVKNIGARSCSRDMGAGPQELYLDQGPSTFWSSDTCSIDKSSDIRTLAAGQSITFSNSWNGRQSNACDATHQASGPAPLAGVYDLRARLGTLRSNPVKLTLS